VSTLVSLHVWRLPPRRVPAALWRVARDRRRLRRLPGVEFAKLLGTGRGMSPTRPDPTRWAILVCWRDGTDPGAFAASAMARAWRRLATAECALYLSPVASRGSWSGRTPFDGDRVAGGDGRVVAITRARLRPSRAARFWRAIGPAAAGLSDAPGLIAAFGIGEAPIGWQGTVSVWRDAAALTDFAYRGEPHREVIARTPTERWYAEELFARFALVDIRGDQSVLGVE
jgi:hypothetical protein